MKYMIASDIHGSAAACRLVLDAFAREQAERLVLLGDILYHGPRNDLPEGYDPKEVIALLNPLKDRILCVRGNCDTEVDQMVLEFPIMAEYMLLRDGAVTVLATHGHHFPEDAPPPMPAGSVLLGGHTHVPACNAHDGFVYMNPGSAAIPKGDSVRSYMTLDNGVFLWKTLAEGTVYKRYPES